MTIVCRIWMICLKLNWFFYDPSWKLQISEFVWTQRCSVWVVLNSFLLKDATERSKISSDQKRLFFAVTLYSLQFFGNTPFKWIIRATFLMEFFFHVWLIDCFWINEFKHLFKDSFFYFFFSFFYILNFFYFRIVAVKKIKLGSRAEAKDGINRTALRSLKLSFLNPFCLIQAILSYLNLFCLI